MKILRPKQDFFQVQVMKRMVLTLAALCVITGFVRAASPNLRVKPPKAQSVKKPKWVKNEIIVKFKEDVSETKSKQINKRHGTSAIYTSPYGHFKRIKIPRGKQPEKFVELYRSEPDVEYAELNYYAYANFEPNDTLYSYQWHFNDPNSSINIEAAWDITSGDPNVIVAILDTGVAYEDYPAPANWHISSYQSYAGHSWWCGRDDPNWESSPGYGNNWKEYLQHAFDLSNTSGPVSLHYQYRHDLEVTYGIAFDKAFIEISTDGGIRWTILKTYTGTSTGNSGWNNEVLSLTDYTGQEVLIRFRIFTDELYSDEDGYFDSDGAFFVDEIKLKDATGTIFSDYVESGQGQWETTQYRMAPDLEQTRFVPGWDFVNNDEHANDDEGHGTHVTGTVAQSTNNGYGVAGVAFNTTIMPVKVLDAGGGGSYEQIADGIYFAVDNDANIINMSLGGPDPAQVLEDALAYAYNNGVTVIASCGNSNVATCGYPAAYDAYVIAVGATQIGATRAPYSSYGTGVDVVAPGGNTSADKNNDGYGDGVLQMTFSETPVDWAFWFYQGTSMAAPHVTGVAALLASRGVTEPNDIRKALEYTARDLGDPGKDSVYGWGLIDTFAALHYFGIPGDFTYNGVLDYADLKRLSDYWLENEPSIDIVPEDGDGIINFLDYSALAESWGK
jgi:subtilisin family serine protease